MTELDQTPGQQAIMVRRSALHAVDLFAGAGGATQGMFNAGFNVVAAVENDPDAAASFTLNHPGVRLYQQDIRSLSALTLLADLGIKAGQLDLLKACPPCQTFSTLGNAAAEDGRRDLVSEVWRFISTLLPRAFVLENVPGLRRDERYRALLRKARGRGYGVREYIVDATDFGVPQSRRRLVVLGAFGLARRDLPDTITSVLPVSFARMESLEAVFQYTAGLAPSADPIHRYRHLRPQTLARLKMVPVGGNRFDLPLELQLACHRNLRGRSAAGPYGRIKLNGTAPTMTTRCTTVSCGSFAHPTEARGISLREAALIQTFPPTYRFSGSYSSIERQIGNAFPVRLAEAASRLAAYALQSMTNHA